MSSKRVVERLEAALRKLYAKPSKDLKQAEFLGHKNSLMARRFKLALIMADATDIAEA